MNRIGTIYKLIPAKLALGTKDERQKSRAIKQDTILENESVYCESEKLTKCKINNLRHFCLSI